MASISEITGEQFNPEAHPDTFEQIPAGDYLAQIIESGVAPTKKGDGQKVVFTFEILEGEFERRLITTSVNIVNPNPVSQSIGRKELAKIATAAGVGVFDDTEELHYKPMGITVYIDKYKYTDKNGTEKDGESAKIKSYHRIGDQKPFDAQEAVKKAGEALSAKTAAAAKPASAPAASGAKPWQRKAA